jgi:DNA helicase-2/ATP-dependent DNA helicase PcrA
VYYLAVFKERWVKLISEENTLNPDWFIGTIHKSKGMEFDIVFIANTSSGNISQHKKTKNSKTDHPFQSFFYNLPNEDKNCGEERRLFYVAVSRAKECVFITYSGVKSEFI